MKRFGLPLVIMFALGLYSIPSLAGSSPAITKGDSLTFNPAQIKRIKETIANSITDKIMADKVVLRINEKLNRALLASREPVKAFEINSWQTLKLIHSRVNNEIVKRVENSISHFDRLKQNERLGERLGLVTAKNELRNASLPSKFKQGLSLASKESLVSDKEISRLAKMDQKESFRLTKQDRIEKSILSNNRMLAKMSTVSSAKSNGKSSVSSSVSASPAPVAVASVATAPANNKEKDNKDKKDNGEAKK